MKDQILLLLSGLIVSAIVWATWAYFGTYVFVYMVLVNIGLITTENYRLRRELRELRAKHPSSPLAPAK
jgi:cytochrome c biogenesis factor